MISQPLELPPPPPPPGMPPPPSPPSGFAPPAWQDPSLVAPPPNYEATLNFRYASFWKRVVAMLIDLILVRIFLLIVFNLIGLVTGLAAFATGATLAPDLDATTTVLVDAIYLVLYAGYFIYFWAMGQTPGMRPFGIYVADAATGGSIGFGNA